MPITWGLLYWPIYLVSVTIGFAVPEVIGLFTNTRNTLSWYAWTEMHVRPMEPFTVHNAGWFLSQGMFLTVASWLLYHIWYMKFT